MRKNAYLAILGHISTYLAYLAIFGIFGRVFERAKYGQVGCPWKDIAKCSSDALVKVLADFPLVITMEDFKVVATADLWAYDAKYLCLSFLTKLHPLGTWEGGI